QTDLELLLGHVDRLRGRARVRDDPGGRGAEQCDRQGGRGGGWARQLHASRYAASGRSDCTTIRPPVSLLDKTIVRLLPAVPRPLVRHLSSRYIAGPSIDDAVRVVRKL